MSGLLGAVLFCLAWTVPDATRAGAEPVESPQAAKRSASPAEALWSLQPLVRPALPVLRQSSGTFANPIDRFIVAKLEEKGLSLSPEANRRALIRRLYFDLIGLPPTPEEIEAFVDDRDPKSYEKLVEQLLASPRYGERWARHWLDVVHYGETHGYDKDKPRPNAWPYRDYVIRAFNEDRPYARFVQEQIAGDVLFPFTRDGIEGLGFLAAGPWDFIGHAEVPETKIDGRIARHLDRDDMVSNTMQTFTSFTVQCAQCHNHKFDPISQEDYYCLQAVFAAIDRTDKEYDLDPVIFRQRTDLKERERKLIAQKKEINDRLAARAGQTLTELDKEIAEAEKSAKKNEAFGYHSNIESNQLAAKWVQVDLGHPVRLRRIELHPCKDDFNNIGEGFGFPVRFKVEVSAEATFTTNAVMVIDRTRADLSNPKLQGQAFDAPPDRVRYIRVTATKLAPRQNDYIFALAELRALDMAGTNVALAAAVTALDSIEAPVRWQKLNLTDGSFPAAAQAESAELVRLRWARTDLLARHTSEPEKKELADIESGLAEIKTERAQLPPPKLAYVGAVHTGSGAFAGTGKNGGKPRPIFILERGNVQKPGQEVGPGALHAIAELPSRFDLSADQTEGERRAALARWLTDRRHPLTWRSIVNRIWLYHFGRGIVDTPSDFGHMGAAPTHLELLDWLACEFRDEGQSFKKLHELIVTSATYRQSSQMDRADATAGELSRAAASGPEREHLFASASDRENHVRGAEQDADNRFLWRMNRRKLEAEAIRDAILSLAGELDLTMGGPSFQDFVIEKPEHSPHYEYDLHDPEDPKSHRRSIYRFIVRSQQQPFMTTLDCADPSMQVAKRNESVSPLQALTMLNDALVITMSKHFAARLEKRSGDLPSKVRRAYYETVGHPPSEADERALTRYAKQFGLTNLCRVLLNLNEFAYVD